MAEEITLKSFPFDSANVLNEESGQMEPDREYEAEIFRRYFAKFLSNGVYFGDYKNYKENSMKVSTDGGLTIKVATGAGIIEGADFENEEERVFTLERPASGERIDRVVIRFDKTLSQRNTYLLVKKGDGTAAPVLQRDDNIYEICIAEVTINSTSNLSDDSIVDARLNKDLCGIVNSLITVDGEELYQRFEANIQKIEQEFQEYVNDTKENFALKSEVYTKEGAENKFVPKATEITTAGTNADDYKNEGVYFFNIANTPTNAPINSQGGWLEVKQRKAGNIGAIKQIWYNYGNLNNDNCGVYVRTYINDTNQNVWSKWEKLATVTQKVTTATANLNNYKEEGRYFFTTSTAITNSPDGSGNGWLEVLKGDTDCIKQLFYRYGTANSSDYIIYERTYMVDTWSDWKRLAITSEVVLKENIAVVTAKTKYGATTSGNTSSVTTIFDIDYPTGFNINNTVVISWMVNNIINNPKYSLQLLNSGMTLIHNELSETDKPVKIVLMKV